MHELEYHTDIIKWNNLIQPVFNSIVNQRWKIVALIVSKKPIAIAANNLEKTHPLIHQYNPHRRLHAEIRCIFKAPDRKLKNSTLYIWRKGADDQFLLSKPCSMCMDFIISAGIKKIVYSTNSNSFKELRI